MNKFQEYPLMVYAGGNVRSAYQVVKDATEEAGAAKMGFYRAGEGAKPPEPVTQADEPSPPVEPQRGPGRPKKWAE